ncbi:outer dynein arm-docking complex subunit 4 [Cololabis saira]|uniref:outer dynein arm-docking complex subunit 4 n=1 Tax=Cololabis saira TaxID=129043 RepID=UPI002AD43786|nr:outer dynein arm-docking complex subunit 4 [Cololabis saira]
MSEAKENVEDPTLEVPFSTLLSKGDWFFTKGQYQKASECFTKALTLQPDDKKCIIRRGKCYMKIGQFQNALQEAETLLEGDQSCYEALYQKAEALYYMGNFPFALVFYHRGQKIRPQMREFKLGIQKADESTQRAADTPDRIKERLLISKTDWEVSVSNVQPVPDYLTLKEKDLKTPRSENAVKLRHGELSDDESFLKDLMKNKDFVSGTTKHGEKVEDIIQSCLDLINNSKTLGQETPPTPPKRKHQHPAKKLSTPFEPAQFMLKNLNDIDGELASGNAKRSLKKAEEVLKTVQMWSEKEVPNKKQFLANLHRCIGNALFDLTDMDQALKHYQKDLDFAKQCKCPEEMSKALDKMGRTYAEVEQFSLAIESFEKMIPLVCEDLEKTCLFHHIGCSYVNLNRHEEAREYGLRSAAAADQTGDEKWKMHANVLVAVSELKLEKFESSVAHFEKALDAARVQEDDFAQNSLQKALDDAKQHVKQ